MSRLLLIIFLIISQATTPLKFEVVSIKQADADNPQGIRGWNCRGTDTPGSGGPPPLIVGIGRCRVLGWPVKTIVSVVFRVGADRVTGAPGWAETLPYTIEAKADDAVPATRAQLIEMLQNLLIDRFNLKFHRETREVAGYTLVIDGAGLKVKEVPDDDPNRGLRVSPGSVVGKVPLSMVASAISGPLRAPVTDSTGMTRRYDINLTWKPVEGVSAAEAAVLNEAAVITALREQLGLRVEPRKIPIEFIVIDSVEKPTEN